MLIQHSKMKWKQACQPKFIPFQYFQCTTCFAMNECLDDGSDGDGSATEQKCVVCGEPCVGIGPEFLPAPTESSANQADASSVTVGSKCSICSESDL